MKAASAWLLRCIPGLSILLLLALVEYALQIIQTEYIGFSYPTFLVKHVNPVLAQAVFGAYSVFLHLLSLAFPLRLCQAVRVATKKIEEVHCQELGHRPSSSSDFSDRDFHNPNRELGDDISDPKHVDVEVIMVILLPSYKEEIHILEDSLKVLASHKQAPSNYDIFLAMEERDPNAKSTAEQLVTAFSNRFRHIQYTLHPSSLPGEAPGKSSNISWAAKDVERKYSDRSGWKDILVTVMDSDTHLLGQYFDIVRQRHFVNRQHGHVTDMTLYMPPIVFDRNAHQVPCMVRVADLMWCGAGLSCFQTQPSRSGVGIPTAVYTVPLPLIRLVQGWDTGPGAIGEDLHMMLKCYFATNGRLAIESIPSPASQCNVSTGRYGIRGWIHNHQARYTQGLRHMWGCLDTGFAVHKWSNMGNNRSNSSSSTLPRPRKISHTELELKLSQYQLHGEGAAKVTWRNLVLFSRLFEAHFLPSHLMIVMLASTIYSNLAAPIVHCRMLNFFLDMTAMMRVAGFLVMIGYFLVCYERYHAVCVRARETELKRAGLYEEMKGSLSFRRRWRPSTWVDYVIFPIAGTVFGSVPLMHAAFAHFYSERLVYQVSEKPARSGEV